MASDLGFNEDTEDSLGNSREGSISDRSGDKGRSGY
jgi:hypothetical protein